MKEISVKNNPTNLRVLINGVPDMTLIPKAVAVSAINALEEQISAHYKKKAGERKGE